MKYFDYDFDDDDDDAFDNNDFNDDDSFKNFLNNKGYSQATINHYLSFVRKICQESNIPIDGISDVIDDYLVTDSKKYGPIKKILTEFGISGFGER